LELGTVRAVDIQQEMRDAYLDYAMSVIVARALPDAHDGLKPVQRRILYAMHDMGLRPDALYKKSAAMSHWNTASGYPHSASARTGTWPTSDGRSSRKFSERVSFYGRV
jgi:DNA gyrase subunit A